MAIDWTSKNVVPYVQELGHKIVLYDLWISAMWLVIGGVLPIGLSIWLIRFLMKKKKEANETKDGNIFFDCNGYVDEVVIYISIIIIILLGIGIAFIINNGQCIIQDLVFPEKTIMEFVRPYLNLIG